jgi:cyclic beta-1,2-glucan synthetase
LRGETLHVDPCIPSAWPGYEITFKYRSTRYEIAVENPRGVSRGLTHLELDGEAMPEVSAGIHLIDDGGTHRVRVALG